MVSQEDCSPGMAASVPPYLTKGVQHVRPQKESAASGGARGLLAAGWWCALLADSSCWLQWDPDYPINEYYSQTRILKNQPYNAGETHSPLWCCRPLPLKGLQLLLFAVQLAGRGGGQGLLGLPEVAGSLSNHQRSHATNCRLQAPT